MPLDDRMRRRFERMAGAIEPDAARGREGVRRKSQAATTRGRLADGLVVIAILLIGVAVAPLVINQVAAPKPSPSNPPLVSTSPPAPPSASVPAASIVGSYVVDLSGAGEPLASAGLAGEWRIAFQGDGTMTWGAPPSAGISMMLPHDTYQASAGRLVTNFLRGNVCRGAAAGSYTWTSTTATLTLTVVKDTCADRVAILTTSAWTSQ